MNQIAFSQPRSVLSLWISWFWVIFATALISCSGGGGGTSTYTIGGTVSGLTGGSLVLKNNGGDALTIASNSTSFTFASTQTSGAVYSATVGSQPNGLTCSVSNGSGSISSASISNVNVVCKSQFVYVPNRDTFPTFTVSMYTISPSTGILTSFSPSTVTDSNLNSPIAIAVNPAGTFAYVVNYFSSTVSMFSVWKLEIIFQILVLIPLLMAFGR
jgi:DNA-binding beta-propeller fold protein YncE